MTLKGKECQKKFRGRKSGQAMAGPPTTALEVSNLALLLR